LTISLRKSQKMHLRSVWLLTIYYELHELLHDASDQCGQFSELDLDLVAAVKQGLKKTTLSWMKVIFTTLRPS